MSRSVTWNGQALRVVLLVGLAALLSVPGPVDSATTVPPEAGLAAHYIVFRLQANGEVVSLSHSRVSVAGLASLDQEQLMAALAGVGRDRQPISVAVRSQGGGILFRSLVTVPRWLRGEFHREGGTIDGQVVPLDEPFFAVRVPALSEATLLLTPWDGGAPSRTAVLDLDLLASTTPGTDLGAYTLSSPEGDPANRFDLLIMGDGYTAAQEGDFEADAQQVAGQFFSISPLAEYANYANVHTLFTPSDESGADHPPYSPSCGYEDPSCCGDPAMQGDPLEGLMVDTAFDARYCAYWIHRLLVADEAKVLAAAGAVPDWDSILVLVNDATYGGSGGLIAVVAMHPLAVQIAQHELGHSFAGLADEYESAYPGYPPCSDITGPGCEPNVTDVTVREQIKWNPWIEPTTPIPTPEQSQWNGFVGLFEGARYHSTGMYRSGLSCIMRELGKPFCQVPAQTYVLKLYQGGWGVPEEGISLIEPGSVYPVGPVVLYHPAEATFGAAVLQPLGGPPADIVWLVNGEPVPGENEATFAYSTEADQLGAVEITLVVRDETPLVHPAMADGELTSTYTWAVEVRSRLFVPLALWGE
ncbi:MAG TPA: M64 family metallopeptidase [Anaerolineae bacterium]|nr:M64 family metallopeptidase [Anaerolineae bacterium]